MIEITISRVSGDVDRVWLDVPDDDELGTGSTFDFERDLADVVDRTARRVRGTVRRGGRSIAANPRKFGWDVPGGDKAPGGGKRLATFIKAAIEADLGVRCLIRDRRPLPGRA